METIDIYSPDNRWCENVTLKDTIHWRLIGPAPAVLERNTKCGRWTHTQTWQLTLCEDAAWRAATAAAAAKKPRRRRAAK